MQLSGGTLGITDINNRENTMHKQPETNALVHAAFFCLALTIVAGAHTINLPANLVDATESLETVATGITFGEGPAVDSEGNLFFS
ncbi:MAG: hypothetical protein JW863_18650, partial [Chitinispirillaceae bacterium]|nr:hypothetical protein [Chitinispirillaceae bacterium]